MARLPLGRQQFRAILTGLANPLKGLIQPWDEPLSVMNGQCFVCYQSEPVMIDKSKSFSIIDEEEKFIDLPEDIMEIVNEINEEDEEKKTPQINNRFVRIRYQFTPNEKLLLPEKYKFAINPNEYFQWSKQKCADVILDFIDDRLLLDFLNEDHATILRQNTDTFSKSNFTKHKKRLEDFENDVWDGKNTKIIQPEVELSENNVLYMTKKHCMLYYGKDKIFKTALDVPVFSARQKYQLRLDKNLFPRFTKSDTITAELREIQRNLKINTPNSFIIKFVIHTKQYTADAYISAVCCA